MATQKEAVSEFLSGNIKAALRIASEFRLGVTKEERGTMKRGYECFVHASMYRQLGKDPEACIAEATKVFQLKFL